MALLHFQIVEMHPSLEGVERKEFDARALAAIRRRLEEEPARWSAAEVSAAEIDPLSRGPREDFDFLDGMDEELRDSGTTVSYDLEPSFVALVVRQELAEDRVGCFETQPGISACKRPALERSQSISAEWTER